MPTLEVAMNERTLSVQIGKKARDLQVREKLDPETRVFEKAPGTYPPIIEFSGVGMPQASKEFRDLPQLYAISEEVGRVLRIRTGRE
jgi:hypothetical protein